MKTINNIDLNKQTFFKNNNIDLSLIRDLDKCVSNDIMSNKIKKIINDKTDKLIILNETFNICNNNKNNYINNEFTQQIESFNKLLLLGHKLVKIN